MRIWRCIIPISVTVTFSAKSLPRMLHPRIFHHFAFANPTINLGKGHFPCFRTHIRRGTQSSRGLAACGEFLGIAKPITSCIRHMSNAAGGSDDRVLESLGKNCRYFCSAIG